MAERNKRALLDLLKRPENEVCADCGSTEPDWASYNLGVFLCLDCVGVHRMLGTHISKVKSLRLDNWNDDQVEFMAATGNESAKMKYEQYVPPSYRRPTHRDCQVLREQWIRAKYERNEFMDVERQSYLSGIKEGLLWKRGKDDSKFQQRLFMLNEKENVLKYYVKRDANQPKCSINLSEVNATFCPDKIGNPNGMQLSFIKDGSTRNIYVYSDDGQDIVDWYNAIRSANYNRLKTAYPGASDDDLNNKLTRDYKIEGQLYKTGPRGTGFKKRWFTLDDRRLMYFSDALNAHAKGEVFIGYKGDGYNIREGFPQGINQVTNSFPFTLVTPDRDYYFCAETKQDQEDWINMFRKTIDRVLYPQDQCVAAKFVHKRNKPLQGIVSIKNKLT
ncbi:arf-GAP with dual PH domain-containing protein 1-like [Saccoglossus kowalevskii]|uniref:Arf-GAP with dual PH domain-containing protein 1-like n=1 Tax=Saccoglossus kowalevskii TaxID=10224 RepID=A0ABM0GMS2_SACKO|nr:PREDICTED: arf-GAP with dual PH domain-containing protein 1-like [Saccoglossus kowalevskii]